jgi:hypothetical protein
MQPFEIALIAASVLFLSNACFIVLWREEKKEHDKEKQENVRLSNKIDQIEAARIKEKQSAHDWKARCERAQEKAGNVLRNILEIFEEKGGFKMYEGEEFSHAASRWVKEVNERIRKEQAKDFRPLYHKQRKENADLRDKLRKAWGKYGAEKCQRMKLERKLK